MKVVQTRHLEKNMLLITGKYNVGYVDMIRPSLEYGYDMRIVDLHSRSGETQYKQDPSTEHACCGYFIPEAKLTAEMHDLIKTI